MKQGNKGNHPHIRAGASEIAARFWSAAVLCRFVGPALLVGAFFSGCRHTGSPPEYSALLPTQTTLSPESRIGQRNPEIAASVPAAVDTAPAPPITAPDPESSRKARQNPAPAPRTVAPVASAPQERSTFSRVNMNSRIDPGWLQPSTDRFTLGPGDRVELEVVGDPTSRTDTVVGPDGKIYFNLLPGIDVWGSTLPDAKAKLEAELNKFVKERPQVSIVVRGVESKRIWVLGRVQAPGVYSMMAPMTLLEAMSMAGGTMSLSNFQDQEAAGIGEELADLQRSFLVRKGQVIPVNFARLMKDGDMSQNIYLQPDDFVYVPAATSREIYVLGAVAQPRRVPYQPGLGVAAAVASAYGTVKGAYMHHVLVIRGSLSQPEVAVVDYRNLLKGDARDLELQPHDIVYVPFSPYRYLQKYIEVALNTFASAAAINAGSQLVTTRNTSGAAGVFIPVGSGVSIIPPVSAPPIR